MARHRGRLRIGTSGWQYRHWRGPFYAQGLPQRQWFSHYAGHFDTVEINNSFYRLPAPETFARWRQQAPPGFVYAVKFSRYGSHLKRLRDAEATISRFVAAAGQLGPTLGPVLVQLPPNFPADPARLASFLDAAPNDLRWAVEFRDPSWLAEEVFDILRGHRAALVLHDKIPDHPTALTAEWTYVRYHGGRGAGGNYTPSQLRAEAQRIEELLDGGHDVFAYFNNDAHGYAISNAADLRQLVIAK